MIPPPLIHVTLDTSSLGPAFERWRQLRRARGRSDDGVPRKVMRFWISDAIRRIPAGDSAIIERDLLKKLDKFTARAASASGARRGSSRQRRGARRASALAEKYRGTLAALLVQRLNWQNANTAVRKNGSPAFYGKVGQFVGARKWSRNLHKAGFYPVLQTLKRMENPGYLPRGLKKAPGTYSEKFADGAALLIAENMASAAQRPGGRVPATITGLAPNCLTESEATVVRLFEAWALQDEIAFAQKSGFFARAS